MILILGGTTEGRIAAATLEEAGQPFYYSTKGDEQEVTLHNGLRLQGAMNSTALTECCQSKAIRLIVDAAHPFASQLHETVAWVASHLQIPVIRFERIFPPRDEEHITWCDSYEEAIRLIRKEEIYLLLALTGVQSIGKLKSLWQESTRCYFRILDRDSSRQLARKEGFPEQYLRYYHQGEEERPLMEQLHPEAILIKESGLSGGFCEKVSAARSLGIRIFALRRPATPTSFHCINGPHGLRRMVEKWLPDFYPLHSGLTTGTCAAAAAVAALQDLFCYDTPRPREAAVVLPDGETISVSVGRRKGFPHSIIDTNGWGTMEVDAGVIKDAGDDPDITNGMEICARVSVPFRIKGAKSEEEARDYTILILGGEGIGTVTLPGLGLEVGAAAINETPHRMIEQNVRLTLQRLGISPSPRPVIVTLYVPDGEEIAHRTFNPRIGVMGGISIIGTSGIVKPFSSEAFVSSIRKSMKVAQATGTPRIVISSGAKSEKTIKAHYPGLPEQAFVHYGNFIGETLKIAAELKIPRVTLGVMIGKAVKLAEGHLDTHSKKVVMNKTFISSIARQAGCNETDMATIDRLTLARELWDILPAEQLSRFVQLLLAECLYHCAPLLPEGELTVLLIDEKGNIYEYSNETN